MTNETKKALREARIEWRQQMVGIITHLLNDDEFYFSELQYSTKGADDEWCKHALNLRSELRCLRSTLENINKYSEMIVEG